MAELEKISMADIKKAIGKGWIANVKEDEIMHNPLLARIVQPKPSEEATSDSYGARTTKAREKNPPFIDMFLRCPRCQHAQHIYVYNLDDKPWLKCNACDELSPSGAWGVITVGNKVS